MAPGTTIQKRKRDADTGAPEAVENASDRDTARKSTKKFRIDAQNGATAARESDGASAEPKRRGRPRKSLDTAPEPLAEASEPKKRGRPRKSLDSVAEAEPEAQAVQQSKKPGRPQRNLDTAPEATPAVEAENPKKRGRPAKAHNVEDQAENETEETRPSKRAKPAGREGQEPPPNQRAKSGKPTDVLSRKSIEATTGNGEPSNPAARRSQRDRRSADDNPWWSSKDNQAPEASNGPDEQIAAKQGKQGGQRPQISTKDKPSKGKAAMNPPAQKPPNVDEPSKEKRAPKVAKPKPTQDSGGRRSARDRRSADDNPWWASQTGGPSPSNAGPEKAPSSPSRGAGPSRSSLAEVLVSEVQNKSSDGRKGKQGKKATVSGQEAAAAATPKAANTKRIPGKGAARPYAGAPDEGRRVSGTNPPETQRRRRSDQAIDPQAETPSVPVPKYRHLTSRTRQIPRATITAKWSPLDDGAIAAIDGIISNCSLPVLSRFRDRQQRHQQAQTIMRTFGKRLHSKLLKGMPFPPPSSTARGAGGVAGHELELDFERTVDAIQALETTLDPLLHSVALLEAEREREEAALEKEYKELQTLETNARVEARGWRERGKRDHVLAPGPRETRDGQAVLSSPLNTVGAAPVSGVFSDIKEKDLVAISQQIGNHMESMRSNLQQIDGVMPAIVKSRAALQGVLHQHLDPAQYDQAVLG